MPLLIVIALMALPFLEIWLMILIGQQIGVAWTIAALFVLCVAGAVVMRRAGTRAFRETDQLMRTGVSPRGGPLDTLMTLVGGILLLIPGFITGVLGGMLALPFTRPALRWAFMAWTERRMKRMGVTVDPNSATAGQRVPGQERNRGAPGQGKVIQGHIVEDGKAGD